MDVKPATKGRVYITLPKEYMESLMKHYDLDHGLFLRNLNPSLNRRSIQDYFETWGTVTACEITLNPNPEIQNAVAYLRFSSEDEADRADSAGPHTIENIEVEVKRVVHLKMKHTVDEVSTVPAVTS
ncbi:heterogeneous nuclear ribonucleoproteins A1 homolog [Betta splendens]|uniref:Heterogeneous nuclear ribonucleoproteins A1 homolog n=1 Tax=Betta splendens TaxID=158456 RepID=A0A6P7NCQ3_BETSP|nr:heterogeneous nuclear ribonucleoproteins A1 homolog [Betta splendens]